MRADDHLATMFQGWQCPDSQKHQGEYCGIELSTVMGRASKSASRKLKTARDISNGFSNANISHATLHYWEAHA
jgi:hypothetical protein